MSEYHRQSHQTTSVSSVSSVGQGTVAPDGQPEQRQPAWRREFPIDVPRDNEVARRDFLRFLGLTSLAFAVGQVWIVVRNWIRRRQPVPEALAITRVEELPVGGTLVFHYPEEEDPCLLIRTGSAEASTFLAYNQQCTHLSCAVVPDLEHDRLYCPCHHGVFDLKTGRPLAGPPRRPLTRVRLEIRDGVIHATGIELRTV